MMSRVLLCLAGLTTAAALGCDTQARLLSGEGVLCTTSRTANPQRSCDTSEAPYVCIATYEKGGTSAYVCRISCTHSGQCPPGDICCAGHIHGDNRGNPGGCMLPRNCQPPLGTFLPAPTPDSGAAHLDTPPADTNAGERETGTEDGEDAVPDAEIPGDTLANDSRSFDAVPFDAARLGNPRDD